MKRVAPTGGRREFLRKSLLLSTVIAGACVPAWAEEQAAATNGQGLYVIGPMEGYTPHIGTLVSMLNYNRDTIVRTTKSLSMAELDHLHDPNANTIGALLMHLGAVEKWYQVNSFEKRNEFNAEEKKLWDAGLNLGDAGRQNIKGKELKYYIDLISEVRNRTLEEFKKRDDTWLLAVDPDFGRGEQFNTYWKWFHVCEHESNHRGQITWLKGRLPGAKPGRE
jgi:uncharacterized damage-inducible protein DinB